MCARIQAQEEFGDVAGNRASLNISVFGKGWIERERRRKSLLSHSALSRPKGPMTNCHHSHSSLRPDGSSYK